jgi:hypothetical protein
MPGAFLNHVHGLSKEHLMKSESFHPAMIFATLLLLNSSCAIVGPTTGSGEAHVSGGIATVTVSPTTTLSVPVTIGIGDKVAEAAAQAAVGYLTGLSAPVTLLNRAEAVRKGLDAGLTKAADIGQSVDRQALETFVEKVVEKI